MRYEKNCNLLALPYPSQREEGLAKGVACETSLSTLVSQPRLSRGKRDSGQIPIRHLYCILSSRVPNEVGVNINWDAFCKGRSSVFLNSMPKKATLGVFETRWEFDRTLSPHESLARETSLDQTRLN